MNQGTEILMSNSSPSPEERQSLEESITQPKTDIFSNDLENDIPRANHFPVITVVLSLDDPSEPNHVDLGSVPPQIAAAAFKSISYQLEKLSWPSRVSYAGQTIFDPAKLIEDFTGDDDLPEELDEV